MKLRRLLKLVPIAFAVIGCSQIGVVDSNSSSSASGTLVFTANGEDFVRQGFVSKDGWQIDFSNVYVTLSDVTAYQAEPAFEPEKQSQPTAKQTIEVSEPVTVDLAAGDEKAEPVTLATIGNAASGRYNALSWRMVAPTEGPAEGYPLMLVGTATKGAESMRFQLQIAEQLAFVCGDFIGDTRKGILKEGQVADVEATFHFDHLFGDDGAPAEDDINQGALGFEPIAKLAQGGEVSLDSDELQRTLNKDDYETLLALLPSLGHVGEGHCEETLLSK